MTHHVRIAMTAMVRAEIGRLRDDARAAREEGGEGGDDGDEDDRSVWVVGIRAVTGT